MFIQQTADLRVHVSSSLSTKRPSVQPRLSTVKKYKGSPKGHKKKKKKKSNFPSCICLEISFWKVETHLTFQISSQEYLPWCTHRESLVWSEKFWRYRSVFSPKEYFLILHSKAFIPVPLPLTPSHLPTDFLPPHLLLAHSPPFLCYQPSFPPFNQTSVLTHTLPNSLSRQQRTVVTESKGGREKNKHGINGGREEGEGGLAQGHLTCFIAGTW